MACILSEFMPALLDAEAESIYLLREAGHAFSKMAMLWSVGKDSTVLLWLARKAFLGRVPFPLIHIDTTFKIPEMIAWRDRIVRDWQLDLITATNTAALASGRTFPAGLATRFACCTSLKTDALQQVVDTHGFQALIVGVRRDEDATRAKERYVSPRGIDMQWNVVDQPPEFWDQFRTDVPPGTHMRIHPLLHWTELDIWRYIKRESIPVVPLYFDRGDGRRYRSLGCAPCTATIASRARTVDDVIRELEATAVAERSLRAQDQESEDAFERLRRDGYM
jgi:sulfate adenylyltransferase subunit 2